MRDSVAAAFPAYTQRFEGLCTWMYLDVKGLVTTGYGFLIDPVVPAGLVWRDGATGAPPSNNELMQEWWRVKGMRDKCSLGGGYFRAVTRYRASEESLNTYLIKLADSFEGQLRSYFPAWDAMPADAQLGIMSIAWACGPHFPQSWPKFRTAVNQCMWNEAAVESHIDETGNPGVKPRNAAQVQLFLNAAKVSAMPGSAEAKASYFNTLSLPGLG